MQHIAYLRDSKDYPVEIEQLKVDPIEYSEIFIDTVNAKALKRPELEKCIATLNADKTLHVQSADRLARSPIQLRNFIKKILKTEAAIHFHEEDMFLRKNIETELMLRMLDCVADLDSKIFTETMLESKFVKKQARRKSTRFTYTEDEMVSFYQRHEAGESVADIASTLVISTSALYRIFAKVKRQLWGKEGKSHDRPIPK